MRTVTEQNILQKIGELQFQLSQITNRVEARGKLAKLLEDTAASVDDHAAAMEFVDARSEAWTDEKLEKELQALVASLFKKEEVAPEQTKGNDL
jgi:hypothetical protein